MNIDFTGKNALVTGGTRGIGRSIALAYLESGANVLVTSRDSWQPDPAFHEHQSRVSHMAVDFSQPSTVDDFLKQLGSRDIDVLVNNAGINILNTIEETRLEDWDSMMHVNLEAPYRVLRAVLPGMKKKKAGRVVNISSIFGKISRARRSLYTMTKYGIHGLTVTASIESARANVLINTVSPGFVMTDLTKKNLSEEERSALAEQIPAGRLAAPEEIARVVLFLTSDLNTYLTGQNIFVDGGYVTV